MKLFKQAVFPIIFFCGLAAMAFNSSAEKSSEKAENEKVPCTTMYTLCDYGNPDSHEGFLSCMDRNGCG